MIREKELTGAFPSLFFSFLWGLAKNEDFKEFKRICAKSGVFRLLNGKISGFFGQNTREFGYLRFFAKKLLHFDALYDTIPL